jgi:hypothetical protein
VRRDRSHGFARDDCLNYGHLPAHHFQREACNRADAGLGSDTFMGKSIMILAKLFGIRPEDMDDPPTHPSVVQPLQRDQLAEATGTHAALSTGLRAVVSKARPPAGAKPGSAGFDPYNRGTFKKTNAWERINRR